MIRTHDQFEAIEAPDPYGVGRKITIEGDQIISKLTYDAAPLLESAADDRRNTQGEKWGEMRKIGTIPMAVYCQYLVIKDVAQRRKLLLDWLRANPAFVTFDKFLK